ncbi:multidrug and toxin extrusion protein 1-like [Denticeps clupeoides]|uniref:multidrug and toxin extrusion protein 1-like n=1 Tax=Denticeps clupeoides TaxID=299321 RepID=UPI0010A50659|nr:multidrug and toxin extrusion protein 1-like [Denticeps clupeoides]
MEVSNGIMLTDEMERREVDRTRMELRENDLRSVCSRCLRRARNLIPIGYKQEVVQLFKIAVPVCTSQLAGYSTYFISTVFCGHLGRTELAGVALANAVNNIAGVSIGYGLSSACDTLISQTFGSGNLKRVGVILQRAILISLLTCLLCWTALLNSEYILMAFREDPEVIRVAQMYVKIFIIGLPAIFLVQLQVKYLQNQGIVWPLCITDIFALIISALSNYIFLYVLNLGVAGSAAANVISQYSLATMIFLYIQWKGLHKDTWGGWSKDCLQEWGAYMCLAIPSLVMVCLEWWTYEIGEFLAGLINEVELGTQSIVYELATMAYMFPGGFGVAASVRVGTALGSGDTEQAKLSAQMSMACAVSVSLVIAVVFGTTKDIITYIFSSDEHLRKRVSEVMVIYAPLHLIDATAAAAGCTVRALGKQKIGAICNVFGYYGLGLPIGASLMFAAKQGVMGLWTGLFVGVLVQTVIIVVYLIKLNWKKATQEALVRAGVHVSITDTDMSQEVPSENTSTSLPYTENEILSDTVDHGAVTTVGEPLSNKDLALRRGMTLGVILIIFTAGVITHVLLTIKE